MEDSPPDSAMTDSSDWENRSWDELDEEFVVNKPPARDAPPQTVDWDDDDDSDTEMKHASASAERGGQPPRPAAGTSGSSTLVVTPCHGGRFVRFCVSATVFEVTSKYGPPIGYLGKGAYGAVCYAFDSERGELVAIKKIADAFSNPVEGKRALREVKLLRYMDHPNSFLYQLLCGLKYMHSANVLHRDLKPSNLLLDKNGVLKICDLGLARTFAASNPPLTPQVGTLWYKAPEILLHSSLYSTAIDVWSVGCILMELMLRQPLFPGVEEDQQLRLVLELIGTPDKDADFSFLDLTGTSIIRAHPRHARQSFSDMFPNVESKIVIDLVERMLVFDPRKRITVQDALAHPYLATLHDISNEPCCSKQFNFDFEQHIISEEQMKDLIHQEALSFNPDYQ